MALTPTQIASLLNGAPASKFQQVKSGKFEGRSAPMVRTRKGSSRGNGGSRQYIPTMQEWEVIFAPVYPAVNQ